MAGTWHWGDLLYRITLTPRPVPDDGRWHEVTRLAVAAAGRCPPTALCAPQGRTLAAWDLAEPGCDGPMRGPMDALFSADQAAARCRRPGAPWPPGTAEKAAPRGVVYGWISRNRSASRPPR